jgi:3',5'-cyclic AMP phosphodiesterase CpdA
MLIAQITDLHINPPGKKSMGLVDTAAMLEAAIARLNALDPQPDVVLATGDLVDFGSAAEYGLLRELLSPLRAPLRVIPGNHDSREGLAAAFADHAYLPRARGGADYIHYTLEDWPVRLVAFDTIVPGEPGGHAGAERCAWLDRTLGAAPERPTAIFMHHPPFATGIGHMDAMGLRDAENLAAVVRRHPQVERVMCGHLHRAIQVRWAGTVASTAPSTAHQVTLDIRPGAKGTFVMEPPGFQLHVWRPGTGLISHTAYVGAFGGPRSFH